MASHPWRSKRVTGPANRLKPISIDPLDEIGLPSKGDDRLLSFNIQESYFEKIRTRCIRLEPKQDHTSDVAGLENALDKLQLQQPNVNTGDERRSVVLMAMRKLREGIVASARADQFALDAYKFVIRTAISWQSFESYQPALLHLLYRLHPRRPLSESDVSEFASYQVLDLACRTSEFGQAYVVRLEWRLQSSIVDGVLSALIRGDWRAFWASKQKSDRHQKALIAMAESRVRSNAVLGLAKSYFTLDARFVEGCAGMKPRELLERQLVEWQLDGDTVQLRKLRGK